MSLKILLITLVCASSGLHLFAAEPNQDFSNNWHQWRGPLATGASPSGTPPREWSEEKNIAWKVDLPGLGSTTPIVWGDQVFVLTSINTGRVDPSLPKPEDQPDRPFGITYPNTFYQLMVLSYDRHTGKELWRKIAAEKVPHEGHHGDNNYASASPTTDGKRLYCWFGSQGLFCFDLSGKLLWEKDLGPVETRLSFGEGAAPVIYQDRLIINRDHDGQSYIVVLDATDGSEIWRKNRDELSTWNTPLVVEAAGKTQVIVNAPNRVRSYHLDNGDLIWECGGQVSNVAPSIVTDGKNAFCMSGYRGSFAVSIPLDSKGDVTDSDKLGWTLQQGTPYVPSPLLVDDLLYFTQSNNAILSCVDAKTGEILIERTRMPGLRAIYSSPVSANGCVYFTGRDGETLVLEQGADFKILATNKLDDAIDASAVIVGNSLYLRGKRSLYCIRESK
ncbi:PQQ-binding-like beta-propeller repeat protein [Thalassoglobus polymorphus]|uniref:Outer membrane biogenesis protein BamB n=1 Tax=Thalassoglobus polymorphus TaxID=2527994 RepID=A0A517QJI1_9PLAN|nr:PQQ-binding-like beta-propeller repeat protein [Thalassoglobus polymorphus]QDT31778.1 outer membrane biogenesis protein BamB [Thalassoglobus polymorphus]